MGGGPEKGKPHTGKGLEINIRFDEEKEQVSGSEGVRGERTWYRGTMKKKIGGEIVFWKKLRLGDGRPAPFGGPEKASRLFN